MNTTKIAFHDIASKNKFKREQSILDGDIMHESQADLVLIGDWTTYTKTEHWSHVIYNSYVLTDGE